MSGELRLEASHRDMVLIPSIACKDHRQIFVEHVQRFIGRADE